MAFFASFFLLPFVSLVNLRMCIRIVRFCLSTKLVLTCFGSGQYLLARFGVTPSRTLPANCPRRCEIVGVRIDKGFVQTRVLLQGTANSRLRRRRSQSYVHLSGRRWPIFSRFLILFSRAHDFSQIF